MPRFTKTIAGMALAATLLAGCGSVTTAGLLRGPDEGSAAVQSQSHKAEKSGGNWRGMPGVHDFGIPRSMFRKAAKRLALTEAQQERFRAIAKSHAAAVKAGDFASFHDQLKTLLLADKVDEAALRSFINARTTEFAGRAASHADLAAEMRAELTAEQRKELVAIIQGARETDEIKQERKEMHRRARKGMDAYKAKLQLNAEQGAAFDALKAKLDAARKAERPALKQATVAFVESGDKAAFGQALRDAVARHVPTDELVRVASLLDKSQRERIVARMERFGKKRRSHGHKR
ncbi:MAG: Spy/CpxP family protein refolding chaperone [Candidatus Sericytochromatia bacterium]|nr:Spy/CpxP family protein refolding chaperone [Candidatus Tanganyikabacteria bacterium]